MRHSGTKGPFYPILFLFLNSTRNLKRPSALWLESLAINQCAWPISPKGLSELSHHAFQKWKWLCRSDLVRFHFAALTSSPLRKLIYNGSTHKFKNKITPDICYNKWQMEGTCSGALQSRTLKGTRQEKRPSKDLPAGWRRVLGGGEGPYNNIKVKPITICSGWQDTGTV